MKKILLSFMLSAPLLSGAKEASNIEYFASQVAQHAINFPKPKNHLEKWTLDMWNFSAITCLKEAKIPLPAYFKNLRPHSSGTYRFPKNVATYCENLSAGPALQCFNLKSTQPPFGMPRPGMSSDYMYLEKETSSVNGPIVVGGYCYLSAKSTNEDKQFYTGYGRFQWTQMPSIKNLNTARGPQSVLMGNGLLSVEGLKQQFPVIAIVIKVSP